jgi:hypothetical protein
LVGAFRIFLSGDKPCSENMIGIQSDAVIIELAKKYLGDKSGFQFFLCSNNIKDFARDNKKSASKMEIASSIKKHFSHIEYYTNLLQLLNDVFQAGFSDESIKDFNKDTSHKKGITINLPRNADGTLLKKLSELLDLYRTGPTKVFISINGNRLETPYSISCDSDAYNDLNKEVKKIFETFAEKGPALL